MRKNVLVMVAIATMSMMLTGCCLGGHEYSDATCEAPATCAKCGATQGEALGHDYADATCEVAATCVRCGATEGEALGHEYAEATCEVAATCVKCGATQGEALGHKIVGANFQEAGTCEVCGQTAGEPLTADFEKAKLGVEVQSGEKFEVLVGLGGSDKTKMDTAYIFDYGVVDESDYKVLKKYGTPEGYEWRKSGRFYKEDPNYYISLYNNNEDYYDIRLHDDSRESLASPADSVSASLYTVNYYGEEYTECMQIHHWVYGEYVTDVGNCDGLYSYYRVPVGYNGVVVGIPRRDIEWPDGAYYDDVAKDRDDCYWLRLK